jgi:hypothetical protein
MNRFKTKVLNIMPVRYQTPKQSNICYMAFRVTYWIDGTSAGWPDRLKTVLSHNPDYSNGSVIIQITWFDPSVY